MSLTHNMLLDIGLSEDRDTLRRRVSAAASELGFGLFSGALIRGDLRSGRAWVETVSNTPIGFIEAQRALDDALRDPVTAALSAATSPLAYDRAFYEAAGAPDLWDLQAPYGYRCGVATSLHEPSHAEQYLFGIEGPDALPSSPGQLAYLQAMVQMLMLHTHEAMHRLYTPAPSEAVDLTPVERECLQWARDGCTVWHTGKMVVISESEVRRHRRSARKKLGAASTAGAVLRCIKGGLIDGS